MSGLLGLLLVGSGIAIHLEDVRGLDAGEALVLASELARAIEVRTATVPVVDDPAWGPCEGAADQCLAQIRARTAATEVLLVRAFAAGTRMRVTIERAGRAVEPLSLDLSRGPEGWREPLGAAASSLYAQGQRRVQVPIEPLLDAGPAVGPYVVAGAGVVALAVGIGLGAASASTLAALESGVSPASRAIAEEDGARTQALLANVLFGAASAAVVGGVVWWLFDH